MNPQSHPYNPIVRFKNRPLVWVEESTKVLVLADGAIRKTAKVSHAKWPDSTKSTWSQRSQDGWSYARRAAWTTLYHRERQTF